MKQVFCAIFLFAVIASFSQIKIAESLRADLTTENNKQVLGELNKLIRNETVTFDHDLSESVIRSFFNSSDESSFSVINFYPLSNTENKVVVAKYNKSGQLEGVFNFLTKNKNGIVSLQVPLRHQTKGWSQTKIGKITYYYPISFNKERAIKFNQKNNEIASKFNLTPEHLDFYICSNYQEIMKLLGHDYSNADNGIVRDGYGVVGGTIFSVMGNEDFSHDMFHYYSGKVNMGVRNWIVEEGLAYSWGNAYYTNIETGEMIEQKELVNELKDYLASNQDETIWSLFDENIKIYNHLAPEASVRSVISGLIANEIMNQHGIEGVNTLISSGRSKDREAYFKVTENLIDLRLENFNEMVSNLLDRYE